MLLLDDLQELFDKENRRRVANTIPEIVTEGGRVIVTTNDHEFGRRVNESSSSSLVKGSVDRRYVHPLNTIRKHIELGIFFDKIEKRRLAFEDPKNNNDASIAQDYVNDLRIYLENRLLDFLQQPSLVFHRSLLFSNFLDGIRKRVNNNIEPSEAPPLKG